MGLVRNYELEHAWGEASDTASRTSPSFALRPLPVSPGGNQFRTTAPVETVPTEHGSKGPLFRAPNNRNAAENSLACPLLPANARMLAACTSLSSLGIPKYHVFRTAGWQNIGTSLSGNAAPNFSIDWFGAICNQINLSIDRANPAALQLSTSWIMHSERINPAGSSTSTTNHTTPGTNKAFTLADGSAFRVGDYVTITQPGGNSQVNVPIKAKASANSITVDTTVALDGSTGAGALTVVKAFFPTSSFTALVDPYRSSDVFIDVEVADSAGVFNTGWTGNNVNVDAVDVTYAAALTPKNFIPDADPDLNGSWSRIADGIPNVSGSITLALAEDEYLEYQPGVSIRKVRMRIMCASAQANGSSTMAAVSSTSTDTETAGANKVFTLASGAGFAIGDLVTMTDGTNTQPATRILAKATNDITVTTSVNLDGSSTPITVTKVGTAAVANAVIRVASATGFAVGDVILLNDGTRQSVATVTLISGQDITVDQLDTQINVGATVQNGAWEIKIPSADILEAPRSPGDENYNIVLSYEASTDPTTGELMIVKAYNDDNA